MEAARDGRSEIEFTPDAAATRSINAFSGVVRGGKTGPALVEEYANDDDDDQMDSWSEGTSPLPCDASHTSDEALPIRQCLVQRQASELADLNH